jgi:hypothetical protein
MRDWEEFEPRWVTLVEVANSLVVGEVATRRAELEQTVRAYLAENPDASQREVEKAVGGKAADVRAAFKRVRDAPVSPNQAELEGCVPVRPNGGTHLGTGCVPSGASLEGRTLDAAPDTDDVAWPE